jgi:hypothetical protein
VDEQSKRHFRRVAGVIDQLPHTDGYDVLVVGGHEYELPEFLRLLPHELRGRVAGTFCCALIPRSVRSKDLLIRTERGYPIRPRNVLGSM